MGRDRMDHLTCGFLDEVNEHFKGRSFMCVLPGGDSEGLPWVVLAEFVKVMGDGMVKVKTLNGQEHVVRPKRLALPFTTADAAAAFTERVKSDARALYARLRKEKEEARGEPEPPPESA